MNDAVSRIASLARDLSARQPLSGEAGGGVDRGDPRWLEALLQLAAARAAEVLGAPRASVRLLDVTRTRLIAVSRVGEPIHPGAEFLLGEGLLGWIAQHNQPVRADNAPLDPRFVARPDASGPIGSFIGAPLTAGGECFGVISAARPDCRPFTDGDEQLLMLLAGLCAPYLELARVQRLAAVDPLTGVFNRRGLDLVLPESGDELVSVAMCDLDRFKSINDGLGHAAGDEVLRKVARLLVSVMRSSDGVMRWGGEEFLLVLPGIELGRARRIVERARSWIEREPIEVDGRCIGITVSVGVAERRAGEAREALIARADEALYVAKNLGRNRVELAA
jgi:diguanylate cyclase (GGDEF)-like protein